MDFCEGSEANSKENDVTVNFYGKKLIINGNELLTVQTVLNKVADKYHPKSEDLILFRGLVKLESDETLHKGIDEYECYVKIYVDLRCSNGKALSIETISGITINELASKISMIISIDKHEITIYKFGESLDDNFTVRACRENTNFEFYCKISLGLRRFNINEVNQILPNTILNIQRIYGIFRSIGLTDIPKIGRIFFQVNGNIDFAVNISSLKMFEKCFFAGEKKYTDLLLKKLPEQYSFSPIYYAEDFTYLSISFFVIFFDLSLWESLQDKLSSKFKLVLIPSDVKVPINWRKMLFSKTITIDDNDFQAIFFIGNQERINKLLHIIENIKSINSKVLHNFENEAEIILDLIGYNEETMQQRESYLNMLENYCNDLHLQLKSENVEGTLEICLEILCYHILSPYSNGYLTKENVSFVKNLGIPCIYNILSDYQTCAMLITFLVEYIREDTRYLDAIACTRQVKCVFPLEQHLIGKLKTLIERIFKLNLKAYTKFKDLARGADPPPNLTDDEITQKIKEICSLIPRSIIGIPSTIDLRGKVFIGGAIGINISILLKTGDSGKAKLIQALLHEIWYKERLLRAPGNFFRYPSPVLEFIGGDLSEGEDCFEDVGYGDIGSKYSYPQKLTSYMIEKLCLGEKLTKKERRKLFIMYNQSISDDRRLSKKSYARGLYCCHLPKVKVYPKYDF